MLLVLSLHVSPHETFIYSGNYEEIHALQEGMMTDRTAAAFNCAVSVLRPYFSFINVSLLRTSIRLLLY